MAMPCVSIGHTDKIYDTDGLAASLVLTQMVGIYQISLAKDIYNQNVLLNVAKIFCAKYTGCTLYEMMVYFGMYLSDYKKTMSNFDTSDILKQFSVFSDDWNKKIDRIGREKEKTPCTELVGVTALYSTLEKWHAKGEDLRGHIIVSMALRNGILTESAVKDIENGKILSNNMAF